MWDGSDFHGAKIALLLGDRILIYQRDRFPGLPFPGHWDLPGGGREGGESPQDCALRETSEEFGLTLDPATICHQRSYTATPGARPAWFLVAPITESHPPMIRFGSEGARWDILPIAAYLALPDAIPAHQSRLRDWLARPRA